MDDMIAARISTEGTDCSMPEGRRRETHTAISFRTLSCLIEYADAGSRLQPESLCLEASLDRLATS
jgi:hypothetical protein